VPSLINKLNQNFLSMETLKNQLSELILKHKLPVTITETREVVCSVAANEIQDESKLIVEKTLPSSYAESVKAFTEEVKPIIEGKDNVDIDVSASISTGDMY
jgi:hypothetical protein